VSKRFPCCDTAVDQENKAFKGCDMKYIVTTKGDWKELKGKLRSKYNDLTDHDVECGEGKYEEMMDGLRGKLGKTRQELVRILNSL
jgi:uncharacterized protein YjbJ (UPF0337 family)